MGSGIRETQGLASNSTGKNLQLVAFSLLPTARAGTSPFLRLKVAEGEGFEPPGWVAPSPDFESPDLLRFWAETAKTW